MKVAGFTGDLIETSFAGKDLWSVAKDVHATVVLEGEGTLRYDIMAGFLTDMRSGSNAINGIIPKFTGNNKYNLAILIHDFNYNVMLNGQHAVSKDMADEMLRQMAIMSGEIGSFKGWLMKRAVSMFGGSAYNSENGDREKVSARFMRFRWDSK